MVKTDNDLEPKSPPKRIEIDWLVVYERNIGYIDREYIDGSDVTLPSMALYCKVLCVVT
jgi:hypothetical protein